MWTYVFKTLWRHRARTLLTVSGTAVAMFVFCFVGSVQQGLHNLTTGSAADRTLVVFQENRFCPTSSRLPVDYANKIGSLPGVREVMPIQVWTNNCRASLDIIVFNGADTQQIQRTRGLTLTAGSWAQFHQQQDAALIGRNVAARRGLSVGDQFSIGPLSVNVAGVFTATRPAEESLIYTGLQFLQYAQQGKAAGVVTQHEVLLEESADPDVLSAQIDETLRAGPVATTTRRKGAFQASTLSDLVDLIGFAHWLGYACVGLVLSLVATTTVMSVQDRIHEYAILQTVGVRPGRAMRLVLAESLTLCVLGGLVGTVVATIALAMGGFAVGAEGACIAFRPSFSLAGMAITVSTVVGLLAGVAPALQAATVPIVEGLRKAG